MTQARAVRFISLRWKLAVPIVAIVSGSAIFTLLFVPPRVARMAVSLATQRAEASAAAISIAVQAGVEFDDAKSVQEMVSQLGAVDGVEYAGVFGHDGAVLGRFAPVKSGHLDQKSEIDIAPMLAKMNGAVSGTVLIDGLTLNIVQDIVTRDPNQRGRIVMGFSLAQMDRERKENVLAIGLAALLVGLIAAALGLALGAAVVRPIRALAQATSAIVRENDLRVHIDARSSDESGVLARSFSEMVAHLREVLLRLRDLAAGLPRMSEAVSTTAAAVAAAASSVLARADETSRATASTLKSLDEASVAITTLDGSVEAASQAITEMDRGNVSVDGTVGDMVGSVDTTVRAVAQLTHSVESIAALVRSQDDAMKKMLDSIAGLDRSTGEIRDAAATTAAAASATQASALGGVESIAQTLEGIQTIHAAASEASTIIVELDARIFEIDRIVEVIREISEQVTLFALNAAIVSAQAGGSGHPFAIIGREIKALAQRTATYTKEISALIGDIQGRSQKARQAMKTGLASVQAGLDLGEKATGALSAIADAASASVRKAEEIAQLTAEQARGTTQLGVSLRQVALSIERISANAAAQAANNSEIMSSSVQMKELAACVAQAIREQRQRGARVQAAIIAIENSSERVRSAQQQQGRDAEKVRTAVVSIQDIARQEALAVTDLDETVMGLRERATVLDEQVRRFRL